jgi:hypothetical protein
VLSFLSSRRNLDSPNPSPTGECAPPLAPGEGHTRWRERGWESPSSNAETYTVVGTLYIYILCGIHHLYRTVHHKLKKTILWVKVLFMKFYWHATRARARFVLVQESAVLGICKIMRRITAMEQLWGDEKDIKFTLCREPSDINAIVCSCQKTGRAMMTLIFGTMQERTEWTKIQHVRGAKCLVRDSIGIYSISSTPL